ncbi:hypothetical protein E2C01_020935 [Portunus trituberculatus]|uniref:Uncharacterized protein n=1 Tax=Portunus trituberculatus TaxID=210409 RepID=A0A5B7E2V9_PORTR|nr:hypothetical protein [Portunus trituberculatus]
MLRSGLAGRGRKVAETSIITSKNTNTRCTTKIIFRGKDGKLKSRRPAAGGRQFSALIRCVHGRPEAVRRGSGGLGQDSGAARSQGGVPTSRPDIFRLPKTYVLLFSSVVRRLMSVFVVGELRQRNQAVGLVSDCLFGGREGGREVEGCD